MGVGIDTSGVWIHRASQPSYYGVFVHLPTARRLQLQGRQFGRVEPFAGGILRLIRGPARSRTVEVTADKVPRHDAERLDSWAGEYLVYRDVFGRALWGTFLNFAITEAIRFADGSAVASVRFTFLGTTATASELESFRAKYPGVIYPTRGYGLEELDT